MLRFSTVAALTSCLALLALFPLSGRADEKGDALLRDVAQATKKTQSLSADVKISYRYGERDMKMTGKLSLQRPNLARVDIEGQPIDQSVFSNGKDLYIVLKSQKQYVKQAASPKGENIRGGFFLTGCFFAPEPKAALGSFIGQKDASPDLKGPETRDGVTYQVLELSGQGGEVRVKAYVNPAKLIQGIALEQKANGQTLRIEEFWVNVKANAPLPAKTFAYTPPAGFKPYSPPRYDEKLLAVGAEAPAFELTKPDDKNKISLAKMLDGRKAVLVNFWFYG